MSNLSMGLCGKLAEALVGIHLYHWIVIYPVDKVIRSLNDTGPQVDKRRSVSTPSKYQLIG